MSLLRKIIGGTLLVGFIVLSLMAAGRYDSGFTAGFLMELDPLVAVTTSLATGVLYAGLWMGIVVLIATLFFGRFFCSWVCPLGVSQDLAAVLPASRKASIKKAKNRYRAIYHLKYGILTALLVLAVLGPVQIGLLDPLALFLRSVTGLVVPSLQATGLPLGASQRLGAGAFVTGMLLVSILVATRFVPRAWCRTACPLGALLGLAARWSLFQIRRDPAKCTDCGLCNQVCHGAANPQGAFRPSECVLCFNCVTVCPEHALSYGRSNTFKIQSDQSPDLTRRRILTATGAGLVAYPLLRSGTGSTRKPDPALIRPPGSLSEREFLSRCVKCAACMDVCPTGGLQPAQGQGGIEALWTPVLIPTIGFCESTCTLCGEHCPTGAIRQLTLDDRRGRPGKPPVKIGTAFIDRGRCLAWGMDRPCLVCEEVCPVSPKAIVTVEGRRSDGSKLLLPRVEPSRCIGCGICENHCPVVDRPAIQVSSVGETRSHKNRFLLKPS
ncbi:MAG: 4Fe-4S binding protein [Deltaproteobacteria bacterium]|nr:4Fe-4S binding protein [Deltaproteobacteria bacterium]